MEKILIVEDDDLLNKTLAYSMTHNHYEVTSAYNMIEARKLFRENQYQLFILDVNLPDGNGFELCREIKEQDKECGIIFLTVHDLESDMIRGFEVGADDYVVNPFPLSVFQKKVEALLSRLVKQRVKDIYDDGRLHIDFSEMTATLDKKQLSLTPMEYRVLKVLIENKKIVLTRQMLLEKLWDVDERFVDEHALTSTISRIRSKIERQGISYIKTVYGMGYMWRGVEQSEN